MGRMGHVMWTNRQTDAGMGIYWSGRRGKAGAGGAKASLIASRPPAATMGCCCSSDYDEDWIENIDICEHCNYPIEPDSKSQVRRGRAEPLSPISEAKYLRRWLWDGQIPGK